MATTQQKTAGGVLVGIAAIIAALLALNGGGSAPPTTTRPPAVTTTVVRPSSTTTTTIPGAPVAPWFAPTASWNRPITEFGLSPTLQPYAQRLWSYGGGSAPVGSFGWAFGDYSVPIYHASDATTIARMYQTVQSQALYVTGYTGLKIGDPLPWNPTWKPGTGNDNLMAIIDDATGRVWELGGIGQAKINCVELFGLGPNSRAGYDQGNATHLCTTGGSRWDGLYTVTDGTTIDGRGAGINKLALLTRADEVASGAIRHALELTITATMFGSPTCIPPRGSSATGFGVSCGGFLPPATKIERINPDVGCAAQKVTDAERSKTIPEGMRFALKVTDTQIDQWLDSRGFTGATRSTARIFAVALRDYGWVVAESGCFSMHFEMESGTAGPSVAKWKTLGVQPDALGYVDFATGLITADRIVVIQPPA